MKRILLAFTLAGVFFLNGCALFSTTSVTTATTASVSTLSTSSTSTTSSHELDYSDFASLHITNVGDQLMMPEVTYYVYYYGVSCAHCIEIKETVLETVQGLQDDKFYFVSVSSINDVVDGAGVTSTPTVIKVVNGAVAARYVGKSQILPLLSTLS